MPFNPDAPKRTGKPIHAGQGAHDRRRQRFHDLGRVRARFHEQIDTAWIAPPTITRWPGGAPLEQIRFAAANHLLVDLGYQGTSRRIEPYALRRSQAGDLLVYALKAHTGEVRSYRVDRIESVRVTNTAFTPRYGIELSVALPVRTGWRR